MNDFSNQIHFSLQGKGGVGKSVVASILSQYIKEFENDVAVLDTDPVNNTLFEFKGLNPRYIQTLEEKDGEMVINPERFDLLMGVIIEDQNPAVLDIGASNYVVMKNYLLSNRIFDILSENGKKVFFHVPIVGGQSFLSCLKELEEISKFPNAEIVVWANQYFGDLCSESGDVYTDSKPYKAAKKHIIGTVEIERKAMHSKDTNNMLSDNLTFNEALAVNDNPVRYGIINKSRLKSVKESIWKQLDAIFLPVE